MRAKIQVGMPRWTRFVLLLLAVMALGIVSWSASPGTFAASSPPPTAEVPTRAQSADEGEHIFGQLCSACHTVGSGDLIGPDLQGVTERREAEWLSRWIAAPDKVLASGDPIATDLLKQYGVPMPNLGLSEAQVSALVAYLGAASENRSGGGAQATAAPLGQASAGEVTEGDPVVGKNLFTGVYEFTHGAPGCLSCHSVSGIGALGGGALGPSLTGAYQRLGDAMITWPQTVPPMKAIFSVRPLTEQEQAHLLAFFRESSAQQRPVQEAWLLGGFAVGGVVVLAALAGLLWRGRLRGVRRPMVAGQRWHRD